MVARSRAEGGPRSWPRALPPPEPARGPSSATELPQHCSQAWVSQVHGGLATSPGPALLTTSGSNGTGLPGEAPALLPPTALAPCSSSCGRCLLHTGTANHAYIPVSQLGLFYMHLVPHTCLFSFTQNMYSFGSKHKTYVSDPRA